MTRLEWYEQTPEGTLSRVQWRRDEYIPGAYDMNPSQIEEIRGNKKLRKQLTETRIVYDVRALKPGEQQALEERLGTELAVPQSPTQPLQEPSPHPQEPFQSLEMPSLEP